MFKHLMRSIVALTILSIISLSALELLAKQQATDCRISRWPSEYSDLEPDPALVRGQLNNGMRYVIMENGEPKDRVALYLFVNAGAINERDDQQGVAHFLEHMMFNGTTNFPAGELVHFFQDIGMNFGGDTNAHTSYDETVYNIMLPENSDEVLRKGLNVLSDYARGALLLEDEVDRERKVILAEKRSRDSAGYRSFVAASEYKYRGTLLAERQIIGTETVLESADSQLLKSYYDAWYRPDNMMLVIVGDLGTHKAIPLIKELFSSLKPASGAGPCPEIGMLKTDGYEAFYYSEKELGRTKVSIESLWNAIPQNHSKRIEIEDLYRYVSFLVMANRLNKIEEKKGGLVSGLGYYSGDLLQRIRYSTIIAETSGDTWGEVLDLLDHTLRQALTHGFHSDEVDRVKKDILAGLESSVLTKESRDSEMLARSIIHQFRENKVFQSPEQKIEFYSSILTEMSAENVTNVFRKDWSENSRLVSVTGDVEIEGNDPKKIILNRYSASQNVEPDIYSEKVVGEFPYLFPTDPDPDNNQIVAAEDLTAIASERIVLANNVVVTLKPTSFEPNTIKLVVDVGRGKMSEPLPGLSLLTDEVVNDSGTGKIKRSVLADLLSGTTVNVRFSVGEESFRWHGSAINTDTELLFDLVYSLIADPGLRDQAFVKAQYALKQLYESIDKTIGGAIHTKVEPFLASNDPRVGVPPFDKVKDLKLEQIREWLLPQVQTGSMEVAIVGDFDPEEIKAYVAKYFGAFAVRDPIIQETSSRTFPVGESRFFDVNSSIEKSMSLVAWPTSGFENIERTRRLHVLAELLSERLRLVVRERLGASYSPTVRNVESRVYTNYGKLLAQVTVEPGREQEIAYEIQQIAEQIRKKGVSIEELERIKGPLSTGLKDSVRTNDYWLYSVLANSTRHPEMLSWPTTLFSDIASITPLEIHDLANMVLIKGKEATVLIRPKRTGQ